MQVKYLKEKRATKNLKNFQFPVFQGTGLEFLIFCGVCTSLLILACMVSMCNRPRELMIIPTVQTPAAIEARSIENAQDIVSRKEIARFH